MGKHSVVPSVQTQGPQTLELDAAYSDSSISSSDQAAPSEELTYVDIDTFLSSF